MPTLFFRLITKEIKIKIDLDTYDTKDIIINNEIVLKISSSDEGYTFDIFSKKLYDKEKYDEGHLTGTYVFFLEIDEMNERG